MFLGVRGFHRREVAVSDGLLFHDVHLFEAVVGEGLRHQGDSGAVQRGVDNAELLRRGHRLGVQRQTAHQRQVDVVHVDPLSIFISGIIRGALQPIDFVAVVFLRVVRGGDHDAGVALQVANREGEFWRRAQRVEQIDLYFVGCQNVGCDLGEFGAEVARIVGDGHLDVLLEAFDQVVGQSLRGEADRVFVHAVGAHAQDAAQTASAEFKGFVKSVRQRRRIFRLHSQNLFFRVLVVIAVQPGVDVLLGDIFCHIGWFYCLQFRVYSLEFRGVLKSTGAHHS